MNNTFSTTIEFYPFARTIDGVVIDEALDAIVKLHCPKDSDGWSIAGADPPLGGSALVWSRISQVELCKGRKE